MKKLLVIGNSHVAALKQGYESIHEKKFDSHFWSIPGGGGPHLSFDSVGNLLGGECVVSDCLSKGTDPLPIKDYDLILLSGVGIPAIRTSNNTHHRNAVPSGFVSACNISSLKRTLVSQSCYTEIVRSSLKKYPSFENIQKIKTRYPGRVVVQMFPLPTQGVVTQPDSDMSVYGDHALSFLAWYYKLQSFMLLEECMRVGAEMVEYPSHWLDKGLTPSCFSSKDAWHMNLEFGKFFFEHLINRFA